jgi:UDP-N-acetylglucosamine/UDP-N-acetylgalactosamine diphosphorylase
MVKIEFEDAEALELKLNSIGQGHLFRYWQEINDQERSSLCSDLKEIDLDQLTKAFAMSLDAFHLGSKTNDCAMSPIPDECRGSIDEISDEELLTKYETIGLEAIAKGEVAVILLAGGQGTRLGVSYPKGMFSVGLPSNKTLFQLQAERLLKVTQIANSTKLNLDSCKNCEIPWYIMTSGPTMKATKDFFKTNNHFGLNEDSVHFFEQGTLPCFGLDGKLMMKSKHELCSAPDGNGGLYKALVKQNILDDMERRGIKYIHIYCVDNILVKVADPMFIGFCIDKNANCGAKVVKKVNADEKVGVICQVNNKFQVVEYSEISEELRNCRSNNGDLKYNAGNICNHFLSFDFLNEFCRHHEDELKYHIAEKKIPCLDNDGVFQTPSAVNGIKLEKFIFDIFQFSNADWAKGTFAVWDVVREDEFSPLKNATSAKTDNANTCRNDLLSLHAKWLSQANVQYDHDFKKYLRFNLKNNFT